MGAAAAAAAAAAEADDSAMVVDVDDVDVADVTGVVILQSLPFQLQRLTECTIAGLLQSTAARGMRAKRDWLRMQSQRGEYVAVTKHARDPASGEVFTFSL